MLSKKILERFVEGMKGTKGYTMTGYGVVEWKPDNDSWIREFDFFGLWV
jgi:hypothetical protein